MNTPSLMICPDDPFWTPPDDKRLDEFLQLVQLIGPTLDQPMHFLVGERFLDHIAFMGCSPNINLIPDQDNGSFCFVHLQPATDQVEFHHGERTCAPRCPKCRSPINDWQERIVNWQNARLSEWTCARCQFRAAPWQFNWRRSAAFSRCSIIIRNIFPKEAIPQTQLLDALAAHFGIRWHYFYNN